MASTSALASIGALIGDPARANMLLALLDGRALTATELARVAAVAPSTASGHLAQLTQAGLLAMERQGRHRYHRLASAAVAQLLEDALRLAAVGAGPPRRPTVVGPRDAAMRAARTCYDHLAGRLAVALADAMVGRGEIVWSAEGGELTPDGAGRLRGLGVVFDSPPSRGRVFCRPCLDWSERRPHVAGAVGRALCARCLTLGWVRRIDGTRALAVTPSGRLGFRTHFGVECVGVACG